MRVNRMLSDEQGEREMPKKRRRGEVSPGRRTSCSQTQGSLTCDRSVERSVERLEEKAGENTQRTEVCVNTQNAEGQAGNVEVEVQGLLRVHPDLLLEKYTKYRIPSYSYVPEVLRPSLQKLIHLLLTSYLTTENELIVTILLLFPKIFLYYEPNEDETSDAIRPLHTLLTRITKLNNIEDIVEHTRLWLQVDFSATTYQHKQRTQETMDRKLNRLAALDRIFVIRKLAKNNTQPILAPTRAEVEEVASLLDTTTPLPTPESFDSWERRATSVVTPRRVMRALASMNKLAAPGLSGWNHSLMSNLLADKTNINLFAALVSRIAVGNVCGPITKVLTSFHVFPLRQVAKNKIRPVCMGEHWLKLVSKIVWGKVMEEARRLAYVFGDDQFAVGQRDGVAKMNGIISDALAANKTVIMLDARNAFPTVSRRAIIQSLALTAEFLRPVVPMMKIMLCAPHTMFLFHNNERIRAFESTSGIPQGTMDSSFLFTLVTRQLLASHKEYRLLRYIDDFALICEPGQTREALAQISRQANLLGLTFEQTKTKILTRPVASSVSSAQSVPSEPTFVKVLGAYVQATCDKPQANLLRRDVFDFHKICPYPAKVGEYKISAHCAWLVIAKVHAMKLFFLTKASDPCLHNHLMQGSQLFIVEQIQRLLNTQQQFVASFGLLRPDNVVLAKSRDGLSIPLFKEAFAANDVRLTPNKWDKATIFHQTHERIRLSDAHFVLVLAFKLRLLKPRHNLACITEWESVKLDQHSSPEQVANHMLSCVSCSMMYFVRRHEDMNKTVAKYCKRIGMCYTVDPPGLYKDAPPPTRYHGKAGPDGLVVANRTYVIDIAVSKPALQALSDTVRVKRRQYRKFLSDFPSISLLPVVMSYAGVLHTVSRQGLVAFFKEHGNVFREKMDEIHVRLMVNLGVAIELWFCRTTSVWLETNS